MRKIIFLILIYYASRKEQIIGDDNVSIKSEHKSRTLSSWGDESKILKDIYPQ